MSQRTPNPYTRLKELLALKRSRKLTFEESRELIALHEKASADLSLTGEAQVVEYASLRALVAESFNEIYGTLPFSRRPPFEFLRVFYRRTPEFLYKYRLYLGIILLVMLVPAVADAIAVMTGDTVSPQLVLGSQIVQEFDEIVTGDESWALAADIPPTMRPFASVAIMTHNIVIALVVFVVGILLAYGTLVIVSINGYLLGYISALYVYTGAVTDRPELAWYFIAGVAPHGVLEIPAILLAATAGLAIGVSWIFPGRRQRSQALAETAREVLSLASAAAILLVVAALIEGFVTPLGGGLVVDRSAGQGSGI